MLENPVSVRGLIDSDFGTPLRRFYGVLDSFYPEDRQYGTMVILNFKDVEVVESAEPYNFPTATCAIKLSNKKRSAWGIFAESLAELLSDGQDIKDCIGKKLGLFMEEGHIYGEDRITGEDMVGNPWHVFEAEGVTARAEAVGSAKDRAKELLIGKTRAEFNKAAYADTLIRKDTALQRAITDKSFITSLIQLGEIEEDENGVFVA